MSSHNFKSHFHTHTLSHTKNSRTPSIGQRIKGQNFRSGSRIFFRSGCTRLLLYFNTNKPHRFFSFAEYQLHQKTAGHLKGGGGGGERTIKLNRGKCDSLREALPGAPGELARSQARNAMKAKFSALNKK